MGDAWDYLYFYGVPKNSCYSYTSGATTVTGPKCLTQCPDGGSIGKYKAGSYYGRFETINEIMLEIYTNGPI